MEDTNTPATPKTVPTPEETPQKKKRSPNWLPDEEEQLAISWLHISEKPEFANNQSGEVFYRKIELDFNSHSKTHYRDFNQIKTRWVSLNTATLKFSAIYNNIERNPPSGTSPEDWLAAAKTAYHQQTKGLTFNSHSAWQKLRYAAKWRSDPHNEISGTATPVPIPSSDSLAPDDDGSDVTATGIYTPTTRSASFLSRPIGQKAAKKRRIDSSRADDVVSTATELAAIAKDCLTSANEGNDIRREKNDISKGLLKIEEKKLVLAKKKQIVDEKNQLVAEKNQIVAEKKQVVDKEHQQSETQMNDMKMLSQNKNLEDPEACRVILLIKEKIKNKWLARG
ncbi:hypothetical protein PCASD_25085 [Puccinia coronata f. sp. avenae]|uniref:No apical meristem-associated C-terminal domain-containing protein n=1 Tax=Puccinia coronata f. sp. avenae TaxID=200324 RepID=A0A2N5TUZ4_9BASI|nr:hypothetical protein PCASD_25085 [Puccinia coronata f. sp. avenae]